MTRAILITLMTCGTLAAAEGFDTLAAGALREAGTAYGTLQAEAGHAAVITEHTRSAPNSLRLLGGSARTVTLTLDKQVSSPAPCDFWVERWTKRGPFELTVSAVVNGGLKELKKLDAKTPTGGFKTHVEVQLPAGTTGLVLTATTPDDAGALIDDLRIASGPMEIQSVDIVGNKDARPILKRAPINAVAGFKVTTTGLDNAPGVGKVVFRVDKPNQVAKVTLRSSDAGGCNFTTGSGSRVLGTGTPSADGTVTIIGDAGSALKSGDNWIWLDVTPSDSAVVGGKVTISKPSVTIDSATFTPETAPVTRRIGYLVCVPDETVGNQADGAEPRKCVSFRIPGLICTKKGTLIGCFDARYNHSGDLCADIDVAVVRSTDGGQTWTTPAVGMDTGKGGDNGCGDPCILQDETGRIWLQALTCHWGGGASLWTAKTGFGKDTGWWCMTYSDDDGKTWSKELVDITKEVKKEEWTTILAGPGNGITTSKGYIVFPAQIWQRGAKPQQCMSTLCVSKDGGKTWQYGTGIPHATSECQVAELKDGSLMLNCRNEWRSGKRVVYVTKDLGKTWEPHETNLKALQEPTCQASLIAVNSKKYGRILLFSNPKAGNRSHMTVRASRDEGKTWNEGLEYDTRGCWGYSCLTMVDENTVGVFYEAPHSSETSGMHGIGFLKFPLSEVLGESAKPAPKGSKSKK